MYSAKPSYGWAYNVKYPTYPNYSSVVPCRRDGYTRINEPPSRPTAFPTSEPTNAPTSSNPTFPPTISPTSTPSYHNTGSPSSPPSHSPTYQYNPSIVPTVQPSHYNGSLQNHSLAFIVLQSSLQLDRVLYSASAKNLVLFDHNCQLTVSRAVDDCLGLTQGATQFVGESAQPLHHFLVSRYESELAASAAATSPG